ncbi:hypothetical protein J6590_056087 [Homalodisca vitripennis]|nr:hypothetical protein J6590_056087 [Homalodisca vitripennis]
MYRNVFIENNLTLAVTSIQVDKTPDERVLLNRELTFTASHVQLQVINQYVRSVEQQSNPRGRRRLRSATFYIRLG